MPAVERKQALQLAIEELARQRAEIDRLRRESREPIAVVGMACRLPGAATTDDFWNLLARGGDAVAEVPRDRWDADAFYDADPAAVGKMTTKQGGFIREVDQFDPQFFGIAPREAQSMDPQQRLLLEVTWEALEQANIPPADLHGSSTGVFVGITCFDHAIRMSHATGHFNSYAGTGSALNMAAGRVSYVLGLTGPSMAVDTACSSSLVCLHLACQSLRQGESTMALVGGVHLILSPEVMVSFSQARMLAADGRSKAFDASADGYSRGEGCGVVVLKRHADAVANRDTILGIIRGTAVNQDGPSGGLTVPNGISQEQVIRRALDAAGLTPLAVGYVEAHGTGTSLGDPIEVEALAKVYGDGREPERPLLIGSVKTNIGHLEPAAGMAGLLKILLAFQHDVIPRQLHFRTPNPHIPWTDVAVKVAANAVPWPRTGRPRVAGLSAFGFSGTNAHVIVEEAPEVAPREVRQEPLSAASRTHYLLPLSAKSDDALKALASRYLSMLAQSPAGDLASICLTAGAGRAHFPHRLAALVGTTDDARRALEAFVANQPSPALRCGKASNADYRRDVKDVSARLARAYEQLEHDHADHRDPLTDVATLYLEGVAITWQRLHGTTLPARAALPTYPFQRQRYWIEARDRSAVERSAVEPVLPEPPFASWLYRPVWTSLGPAATRCAAQDHRRWTIVPGDRELADRVHLALGRHGVASSLATARDAAATRATDIIFIAGARDADRAGDSCAELLAVIQALRLTPGAAPRIWVVTRGAIPTASEMTVAGAAQAPLAAFARVLGLEHPELFGRLIDLDPAIAPAIAAADVPADADAILAEILQDDGEDQIAIRQGERYAQRIDAVRDDAPHAAPLRDDGSYLISGGLGRIGLHVARDLVRRGARHLCLIGRTGLSTADQRAGVAALEKRGATVRIEMVDVADHAAMTALVRDLSAGPPLRGVVHAAGLSGYADLERLTSDRLAAVLWPKIQGAWTLHDVTRHLPLDFFVCFSSIASAWGSRGQAHYAAGNAFLDALAHLRHGSGLPAVTINWGPWIDGGMTSPEADALLRRVGVRPLATDHALAALGALAQGDRPQIVVADIDWHLFKGSYEARGHRRLLERIAGAAGEAPADVADNQLVRQVQLAAPADRSRLLTAVIQREVAQVLALPEPSRVDPEQGLFEMGMDSLTALELRTRLQTLIARALPATLVFDCPTIHAIAAFIIQQLAGATAAGLRPAPTRPPSPGIPAGPVLDLDALSDDEAEALLLKKLESIH